MEAEWLLIYKVEDKRIIIERMGSHRIFSRNEDKDNHTKPTRIIKF